MRLRNHLIMLNTLQGDYIFMGFYLILLHFVNAFVHQQIYAY